LLHVAQTVWFAWPIRYNSKQCGGAFGYPRLDVLANAVLSLCFRQVWLAVAGQSITQSGVVRSNTGKMQVTVTKDRNRAVLKLAGRFDFNTHREFRAAVEPLELDVELAAVTIDFSEVEYLDSSALGMLLMLRDKMGGAKKDVTLSGVHGNVKQVLDIANFDKLFHIV